MEWAFPLLPFQTMVSNPPPTLLLIDDSGADLRVLIDLIAAKKWRTIVAFDGQDGFRKAQLKQPSLILLDVRMPKIDGFATCRLLKSDSNTRRIPVIFLTAADDKEARLTGLGLGAVDYIIKPYVSEEEVIARIGIHLDLARASSLPQAADTESKDFLPPLLKTATDILLERMSAPPSPELLARELGTNEKKLNQLFRTEFAMPIATWLREQRLKLARQLLAQTDTPIADIAAHCGYTTPANFATAFKERFECSPRDFRRRAMTTVQDDSTA